jgi:hypothetical protein
VIDRDVAQARITHGTDAVPQDAFDSAMDDLIAATMALASSMAELEFCEGARMRGVVERALGRAQVLGEQLSGAGKRSEALHHLAEMHAITTRLLMSAPAPSAAAVAGIKAGDSTLWNAEARAWIASRPPRSADQTPALPQRLAGRESRRVPSEEREVVSELGTPVIASEPRSLRGLESKVGA